jgi:glutamyl endopeptidase
MQMPSTSSLVGRNPWWIAALFLAVAGTTAFAWQREGTGSRVRRPEGRETQVEDGDGRRAAGRGNRSRVSDRREDDDRTSDRKSDSPFEPRGQGNRDASNDADERRELVIESTNGGTAESAFESVPGFKVERAIETGRAERALIRELARAEVAGLEGAADEHAADEELSADQYAEFNALPSVESRLVEREILRAPETVCGEDDRVRVNATTQVPWSANCQLIITMSDGSRARGTGWLIGPRTVITAGHCVYDPDSEEFFQSIEVIAGMNGSARPFGSQTVLSNGLRASEAWKSNGSMASDYGAILLSRPFESPAGVQPATFGAAVLTDTELTNLNVNTVGYPGDRPVGQQWFNGGRLFSVTATRLSYMVDTAGGQSGSAVWRKLPNGQRQVIGIHNYGGCPNRCTRINAQVFADLRRWRDE